VDRGGPPLKDTVNHVPAESGEAVVTEVAFGESTGQISRSSAFFACSSTGKTRHPDVPLNVLLADDDPTMRVLLSHVITQAGHTVTAMAADGEAAWQAYVAAPAPMIILDWEMPRLDGLALCRRIRASAHGDVPFILIVTGRASSEDLTEVLDAGADDYMSKPVTPNRVQARLRIAERRIEVSAARRTAEEELGKARYLAGIGETSLALQHEINNPLAALLSHAALIEQDMLTERETQEALVTIAEQARRIAEVVRRLRQIQNPRSVEYLGSARMIDINPNTPLTPEGPS
jgi:DNA-binding response OmpR family regulator